MCNEKFVDVHVLIKGQLALVLLEPHLFFLGTLLYTKSSLYIKSSLSIDSFLLIVTVNLKHMDLLLDRALILNAINVQ